MANIININILIEMKNEINELIIDDLSPSVFEGILEIYKGAKDISNDTTIMKTFQKCMEKICDWGTNETQKVIGILERRLGSPDRSRIEKLQKMVMAILRINTQILNNQSFEQLLVDVNSISFEDFMKKVYIETARRVWSQPFLFYEKNLNSIEIKRNHIIVLTLIRESILSAIRKLLLSKNVFNSILENNYVVESQQPLNKYQVNEQTGGMDKKEEILNIINNNLKVSESDKNTIQFDNNNVFNGYTPKQPSEKSDMKSDIKSSSTLKKIVNESFDNRNSEQNRHSSKHSSKHSSIRGSNHGSNHSEHNSSRHSTHHNSARSSKNSRHSTRYNTATNDISIDTSVKNKLFKDLMTESPAYNPEDGNEKYQDIFSNSEVPDNSMRKMSKTLNKDKESFYNSYLKK